ncbi:MAG: threonine/serine dehydratase [Firmicutes bacterium]|nr:threonine/serine dehydratase [Bacillota bacterium]
MADAAGQRGETGEGAGWPAAPGPELEAIREAAGRIRPYVRRTPVLAWHAPEEEGPGGRRLLKLEQLQRTGSFKVRGAFNALLSAPASRLRRGVATASGGNHGLAVAWAARRLGVPALVVITEGAPASTEAKLRAYGAEVVRRGATWDDGWAWVREAAGDRLLVHPFDDPAVQAGQGTLGLEMLEAWPWEEPPTLYVAVGGGGLISGVARAVKALRPDAEVVGVEPEGAASMSHALRLGRPEALPAVRTIAGTLAPRAVSASTLAAVARFVDRMVTVSDAELLEAMRLLWQEANLLVEPAGAAAQAGLERELREGRGPAAGGAFLLLCGANLDVDPLFAGLEASLPPPPA